MVPHLVQEDHRPEGGRHPIEEGRRGLKTFERIKQKIAMREFGEPADVATLIAFLVSEHAKYITGQDIHVMGGLDLFTY